MELRPGSRLKSSVCETEVIAIKASGNVDVTCGGAAMVDATSATDAQGEPVSGADGGTAMGKRYVDEGDTIELLCTKPGAGSLGIDDTLLTLKESKPLPASD
ncbi:MAG: hypothetical protein ACR2PK_05345 [Acidimicrobiales bacterium]